MNCMEFIRISIYPKLKIFYNFYEYNLEGSRICVCNVQNFKCNCNEASVLTVTSTAALDGCHKHQGHFPTDGQSASQYLLSNAKRKRSHIFTVRHLQVCPREATSVMVAEQIMP
jgi:hypothetical protein